MQRADLLEPVPVCGLPGRGLPAANTRQTYRVSTPQSQPVEGDYDSKSCGCYAGSLHPAAGCNPSIYDNSASHQTGNIMTTGLLGEQ